jgi:hypothetical protein
MRRFRIAKNTVKTMTEDLKARLAAGAECEPGLGTARLIESKSGISWKSIAMKHIDADLLTRIVAATKRKIVFRLEVK